MAQPILVIMAAGMGSRYGGLKQLDTVGPNGQIIMDYSLYDAYRAGFRRVVFIIRPELKESFIQTIGERAAGRFSVEYAQQTPENIPAGCSAPEGRTKPLGTGHAIWCAAPFIDAPFAVINADDFYGRQAFAIMYDYLQQAQDDHIGRYCMVGYRVENTLSESGTVSRGVCTENAQQELTSITECTAIARDQNGQINCEAGVLAEGTIVSMNLWGFTPSFLTHLDGQLQEFLQTGLKENPLKQELYLPATVNTLLKEQKACAKVLRTDARWFGVTYHEDKPVVQQALADMTAQGVYPASF